MSSGTNYIVEAQENVILLPMFGGVDAHRCAILVLTDFKRAVVTPNNGPWNPAQT
jgi:hypothetical protein